MTVATDLPIEARAFLDALAVGESGEGEHYDVLFGGGHFTGYAAFPQWAGRECAGAMTHAAGRYQFEPATWRGMQIQLKLPDFSPISQDHAAWRLASDTYHRLSGQALETVLLAGKTAGIANRLHSTWTSLSEETFPKRYAAALAAYAKA